MTPIIEIYPDRPAWLKGRGNGIGASDAASVLGMSHWKSNVVLWQEKVGEKVPDNLDNVPLVQYGNDAEPLLRRFFALDHPEYIVTFEPYKIIRHETYPFITCTPDGELQEKATGKRGGLEIKTTEITNSAGWIRWKNRIPDQYYAQVCQQMLAADWQFVELLVQIKFTRGGEDLKEVRHYRIDRKDALEDMELLQHECIKFWRHVTERTRPDLKLPPI